MHSSQIKSLTISVCCLFIVASLFCSSGARAAEYPDRPITLMVAFAPGGSMDLSSRAVAAAAEKLIGKPIVVENKGGGVVLLLWHWWPTPNRMATPVRSNKHGIVRAPQMQQVTYKPLKSFTPIIGFASPRTR